jgi:hypothetical protein
LAFLVGAILGGRVMARANADSQIRFAAQKRMAPSQTRVWNHRGEDQTVGLNVVS